MKLAIAGGAGRMGRVLTRIINETPGAEVAGGLEPKGSPHVGADMGELAGIGRLDVAITDDPIALLTHVDGIIDFTVPQATLALVELSAQARIVHVIGTTGIDEAGDARIKAAARHARIVKSGNMSLGVNLLASLVRKVAATLGEDYDIEIVEMHHKHKIDAPSGTALKMGEIVAEAQGTTLAERAVYAREGETGPRENGTIGFATVRGGDIVGDHTVLFAGDGERIEITHRSNTRQSYAEGAVRAAVFVAGKKGLYDMNDVLGL